MDSKDQDNGNSDSMLASPVPDKDTSVYEPEEGNNNDTQKGPVMNTDSEEPAIFESLPHPVEREIDDSSDPPLGPTIFDESEEIPQAQSKSVGDSNQPDQDELADQPPQPSGNGGGGNDDGGDGDQPFDMPPDDDADGSWYTNRKLRWILGLILVALVASAAYYYFIGFNGDDNVDSDEAGVVEGDDDDVDSDEAGEDDAMIVCQEQSAVNLEEVGVLSYGDSLVYNTINPFWTENSDVDGDVEALFESAIDELYRTVQDGCSPAGAAYWRLVRTHVIDAARPGIDNFDSATRIAAYTEETDTRVAVVKETASQLANCVNIEYVPLTVKEAPRIHVATYADDYTDVVFVSTPLLQLDELSNGDMGLIVIRCSFGKVEGTSDDTVNETLISPSLRAIVYLDQPAGIQPQLIQVLPDIETDDNQNVSESEEELAEVSGEPAVTPGETVTEATEEQQTAAGEDASQTEETVTEEVPPKEPEPVDQTPPTTDSTTEPPVEEVSKDPVDPEPTNDQTEEQKPSEGSGDGCGGTCGTDNGNTDGDTGGDCLNGDCPGNNDGTDDGGDGDDCSGGDCPGDGSDGDDCSGGEPR